MSAHTPGPWRVSDQDDPDFILAGDHEYICQFFSRQDEDFPNKLSNARLIAAAPALLEALVSAESAMMEAYPYVVDTPSNEAVRWTTRATLDAIKQARAAIAQAKGESA